MPKTWQTGPEMKQEKRLVQAAASGNGEALREIMEKYAPLIEAETRHNWLPDMTDDVRGVARLYLVEAVKAYDASRGVPFAAYAQRKVHGGVSTFAAAERRRHQREMRPEDYHCSEDVAEEGGSVWDAIFEAADSLSLPTGGRAGYGQMDAYARVDMQETLKAAISNMGGGEREVFFSLFVRGHTAQETARRTGRSPQRISQLKQQVLKKLRQMFLPAD